MIRSAELIDVVVRWRRSSGGIVQGEFNVAGRFRSLGVLGEGHDLIVLVTHDHDGGVLGGGAWWEVDHRPRVPD